MAELTLVLDRRGHRRANFDAVVHALRIHDFDWWPPANAAALRRFFSSGPTTDRVTRAF